MKGECFEGAGFRVTPSGLIGSKLFLLFKSCLRLLVSPSLSALIFIHDCFHESHREASGVEGRHKGRSMVLRSLELPVWMGLLSEG